MEKSFSFCDVCKMPTDNLHLHRGFEEVCSDCKGIVRKFAQLKGDILKMEDEALMLKWVYYVVGFLFGAGFVGVFWMMLSFY